MLVNIYSAQQKKDMAIAVFQIELTGYLSLVMSALSFGENKRKIEDIFAIVNEVSKQRLVMSVADFNLHGIDVNTVDLEATRNNLVLEVRQLLGLK